MPNSKPNNFFDSQDILLNIEQKHTWGNFGYWENTQSYPVACEQLAKKLGTEAKLQPQDRVLDLGFGCGDQLQLWNQHFGVVNIEGWNISKEQCDIALQKSYDGVVNINHGDFFTKPVNSNSQYDKILALDSAYHFNTRSRFFEFANQQLKPGGMLGLVDLSFNLESVNPFQRRFIKLMAAMVKIPQQNLSSAEQFQAELGKHFELVLWQDITPVVFLPFCDFIRSHHSQFSRFIPASMWRKYQVTSRALTFLCKHNLIQMNLVIARKP